MDFRIAKISQILKLLARSFHQALTSYFWRVEKPCFYPFFLWKRIFEVNEDKGFLHFLPNFCHFWKFIKFGKKWRKPLFFYAFFSKKVLLKLMKTKKMKPKVHLKIVWKTSLMSKKRSWKKISLDHHQVHYMQTCFCQTSRFWRATRCGFWPKIAQKRQK